MRGFKIETATWIQKRLIIKIPMPAGASRSIIERESPRYNRFLKAEATGVVIEICMKYPRGLPGMNATDLTVTVKKIYRPATKTVT
jgi:hypothetical protein